MSEQDYFTDFGFDIEQDIEYDPMQELFDYMEANMPDNTVVGVDVVDLGDDNVVYRRRDVGDDGTIELRPRLIIEVKDEPIVPHDSPIIAITGTNTFLYRKQDKDDDGS